MTLTLVTPQDTTGPADAFQRDGHCVVSGILSEEDMNRLVQTVVPLAPWHFAYTEKGADKAMPVDQLRMMVNRRTRDLNNQIYMEAREGAQYAVSQAAISPQTTATDPVFEEIATFLAGEPVTSLIAKLSGREKLKLSKSDAILISPNQFITRGTSLTRGGDVLVCVDMVRNWRSDWGAVTYFHEKDGHIKQACLPQFNSFRVIDGSSDWSVSVLAPYSPNMRLMILARYTAA